VGKLKIYQGLVLNTPKRRKCFHVCTMITSCKNKMSKSTIKKCIKCVVLLANNNWNNLYRGVRIALCIKNFSIFFVIKNNFGFKKEEEFKDLLSKECLQVSCRWPIMCARGRPPVQGQKSKGRRPAYYERRCRAGIGVYI